MNPDRDYLSVTIPVHDYFISGKKAVSSVYAEKILDILKDNPLTLTELSKAMGYKGITRKLRKAVDELIITKEITRIIGDDNSIKFSHYSAEHDFR